MHDGVTITCCSNQRLYLLFCCRLLHSKPCREIICSLILYVVGQRQCLVQLSTMPVAVCHGVGQNTDEAHAQAAHHALQYLKIMTKKA